MKPLSHHLFCLVLFSISGCVQSAETCQLPCAAQSRTFSHQTLPASASPTQPAEGNSRSYIPDRVCECAALSESMVSHVLLSVPAVASGNNGRAHVGCAGELHRQGTESV